MRAEPPIIWLPPDFAGRFPEPWLALREPDGLLAAGGNLEPDTLIQAYSQGIFPWYSPGQPILWWSPDPRCVVFPDEFHVSRSFRRTISRGGYKITENTAFRDVIRSCSLPRQDQDGTWINDDMIDAYSRLHDLGHAISVECWHERELVGGIYGIFLNDVFFGESMFSKMKDASKLCMHHIATVIRPRLIDAQVQSDHLISLGARMIDREEFLRVIQERE